MTNKLYKNISPFEEFLRLLIEVEVLSMSGAAVAVWPRLPYCMLAYFKSTFNIYKIINVVIYIRKEFLNKNQ